MTKLTKAQARELAYLCRLADRREGLGDTIFGGTEKALRKRGLVERIDGWSSVRITPAGRAALASHKED